MKIRNIMNRKFYMAAMLLLIPFMMGAQALKGSYFLDNSLNRNKLNPALTPTRNYLQIPAVGNLSAEVMSNLELRTFLYPMNGQIYTFLNKNVSIDQFESSLARRPYLDANVDANLINFGWNRGRGFWTFDIGIRVDADVDIPHDLFTFLKKGSTTSGTYDIGTLKANAAAYAYASLGYSRNLYNLVPGLKVGAKIRGIVPAVYADVNLKKVSLTTGTEKWTVNTDGALNAAMSGLELTDSEGNISPDFDMEKLGPAGWGFSVDLGAEYKLRFNGFINGINFSAAVTDLGMIKYKADAVKAYTSKGSMDWTGVKLEFADGAVNEDAFDNVMDDLENQLDNLLKVDEVKNAEALTRSTLPSFYVGVEMPFMRNKMSIGALYSARTSYHYTRNELTVSYNLTPSKWFSMGVNYSFLNVASTMGFMMEFTPKVGPCLYFGLDYIPVEWVKSPAELPVPYLPMSARVNAHIGLSFALGGR